MKKVPLFVLTLLLAFTCFAADVDMSQYSCAVITANGVKAMSPDVPYLNEIEKRTYAKAIENWKLNKGQGAVAPIPDPPLAFELFVDYSKCSVWVARGVKPVIEKYVEPTPVLSTAGAIAPPFAPGRYLCVQGDNAAAGFRITAPDGVVVEKYITQTPFGPMPEYRKVQ